MPKSPAPRFPHHCVACGHDWNSRTDEPPKRCPKCTTLDWEKERPSAADLAQAITDSLIDLKVQEAREIIAILEKRVATLLAQKGKPWVVDTRA